MPQTCIRTKELAEHGSLQRKKPTDRRADETIHTPAAGAASVSTLRCVVPDQLVR